MKNNNKPYQAPPTEYHAMLMENTPDARNEEMQRQQRENAARIARDPIAQHDLAEREAIAAARRTLKADDARDETLENKLTLAAGNSRAARDHAGGIIEREIGGANWPVITEDMKVPQLMSAHVQIVSLLDAFEANLPGYIDEVAEIRSREIKDKTAARAAAREAEIQRFAKGMDDSQVLAWLEKDHHAVVRLSKKHEIEIAPAYLAADVRVRDVIKLHAQGLTELLAARQNFMVVDLG